MTKTSYAIALGSNRRHGRHRAPDRILTAAVAAMAAAGLTVQRVSPILRTPALGPAGRGFANAVAIVASDLGPPALLALLKRIEREFGRRPGRRWGARVLDLDILLWSAGPWPRGHRQAAPGRLAIPHREMTGRRFVLAPLVTVAPDWRLPRSGRTVRQVLRRLTAPCPVSVIG